MSAETGTQVAETPKKSPRALLLEQTEKKLEAMITDQIKAFPKTFNKTRFVQNCLVVLADTKDIEKCKPISIVRTLIKGAYLGLDFFRKECYPIPYKNKETGELELSFQTDYKGERKLCLQYGRGVKDIYAKLVRVGDTLEVGIESGQQKLNFIPKPFNDEEVVGAFAVVIMDNGIMKYETMSKAEIEDVRNKYSKAPDSPAWEKSWGEQAKKTVMRRLCKLVDLHFENHEQEAAYIDGAGADLQQRTGVASAAAPKIEDPFTAGTRKLGSTDAEIVPTPQDVDPILFNEFKKKFPNEEDWQIKVRIKEMQEAAHA